MYNTWIQHNGQKILYTKYSGLTEEQMIKALKEQFEIVKASPGKVRNFGDFTNSTVSSDFMSIAKSNGKELSYKIEKTALIGITGIKKILLNGYNAFTKNPAHPFDTEKEALAFLAKN
ncbi:MAG: hypothetical protein RIG68_18120 [Imperialibacter sp.]|uniref:hypothetical protein n=1 Tax=Imperialibacter sp. TaxID=2038411 RepID=UPI0032EC88E1